MEWSEDDELVEVTPLSIRIRKKALDPTVRRRLARDKKNNK
jgi:GTP-binding protein